MKRTTEVDSRADIKSDAPRAGPTDNESEDEDVFHDARFPADEEAVSCKTYNPCSPHIMRRTCY